MNFSKKNTSLIAVNFLSQLIPLILLPVIASFYSVKQFDELAIFISTVAILSICATCRLDISQPQLRSALLSSVTRSLTLLLVLFNCTLLIIVFNVFNLLNSHILNILVPITVVFMSVYSINSFCLTRSGKIKQLINLKLVMAIIVAIFQLGFVMTNVTSQGLVLSVVFGYLIIGLATHRMYGYTKIRIHKKSQYLATLKKNKNYVFFTLPDSLTNSVSHHLPVIMFAYFSLDGYSALYFMALKIFYTPISLISSVYGNLFQSKILEFCKKGRDRELVLETVKRVAVITIAISLFYVFIGGWIINYFFSDDWSALHGTILCFLPWIIMQAIVSPISTLLIYHSKQKILLKINLIFLVIKFFGLLIAVKANINPCVLIGMVSCLMYLVIFSLVANMVSIKISDLWKRA
jgi:O-antigen/teichoic acid export membrane protein